MTKFIDSSIIERQKKWINHWSITVVCFDRMQKLNVKYKMTCTAFKNFGYYNNTNLNIASHDRPYSTLYRFNKKKKSKSINFNKYFSVQRVCGFSDYGHWSSIKTSENLLVASMIYSPVYIFIYSSCFSLHYTIVWALFSFYYYTLCKTWRQNDARVDWV